MSLQEEARASNLGVGVPGGAEAAVLHKMFTVAATHRSRGGKAGFYQRIQLCMRDLSLETNAISKGQRLSALSDYYQVSGESLSSLRPSCLGLSCAPGCKSSSHQHVINLYYNKMIASLRTSKRCTNPRIPHAALRPF